MLTDEFAFIQSIIPQNEHQPSLIKGIGDDAALFQPKPGYVNVVCVDTLVEDIHFTRDTLTPFQIGYKALAVNVSDLAAMGGIPLFYLVSIAIPANKWTKSELQSVYLGMNQLGSMFNMDLIGGDTVATVDRLIITVTAIGQVEKNRQFFRSEARAGDVVFVTGTVGAASAGLDLLLQKSNTYEPFNEDEKALIEEHCHPLPQVHAGRLLAQLNCRVALNDLSDGIASEANELAEASQQTIIIDYDKIPKHPSLVNYEPEEIERYILFGGEDFQLLGTIAPNKWKELQTLFQKNEVQVTAIGHVEAGEEAVLLLKDNVANPLDKSGYNHFMPNE